MQKRPLIQLENELLDSLVSKDSEGILEILKERPDLTVFFCSLAIRIQEQRSMKTVLDILPEELEHLRLTIKRMTFIRPPKNQKKEEIVEETPLAS